ncbi:endonuclease domain-containing protein [Brevundimonas lenta]|uniref:Very-short-patch-repair endonuclease n=1 Tax=Brevundimonas lenta TaxID=424796 RepID=A0A7W6JEU5_9CAUL|nr:endonuclease domain-containing protein [Brevundimonas lenta]MBB4083756.1 very-short-patch-repair endonuclease [Brevundimonas lenta]
MSAPRTTRARDLRQSSGLAEQRVWERLRGGRIDGHKFRRQHPIGRWYADFACDRLRLVIELDGGIHALDEVALRDHLRQQQIEGLGWTVLRFTNKAVLDHPEALIAAIRRHAATR